MNGLSQREKAVLRLIQAGHTAKSAGAELGLSVHTVNDYLREARKKLGVNSSKEAARALAKQDELPPNSIAPYQLGMGAAQTRHHNGPPSPTPASDRTIIRWITGGTAMFAIVLSAALMSVGGPPPHNSADPRSVTVRQTDAAAKPALEWVVLTDRGDWKASWEKAGSLFRGSVTAAAWADQVEPVRKPLGKVVRRVVKSVKDYSELPGAPAGSYRIVEFHTNFAKAPGAVETVVMAQEGNSWKIVGYFIK